MYPALKPVFNRGGVGPSLSRAESAARLAPLVAQHQRLLKRYDAALAGLGSGALTDDLAPMLSRARVELSKLKETVFSMGGTPPNGTDLDPLPPVTARQRQVTEALIDDEQGYLRALDAELALNHQIRTQAILANNKMGIETRLGALKAAASGRRLDTSDRAVMHGADHSVRANPEVRDTDAAGRAEHEKPSATEAPTKPE
jgi:hypothetical protein